MADVDPHALEVLYDRHVRAMYGLALRILRDPGKAETAVQAVFSDAWSRLQAADGAPEPTAPRLLEATRRRAIEQLRALSPSSPDDPAVVEMPRPAIADERPALSDEAVARLRAALADLPVLERIAIELAGLEGLTAFQIAECIEQPLESVGPRIHAGLSKLRGALTT